MLPFLAFALLLSLRLSASQQDNCFEPPLPVDIKQPYPQALVDALNQLSANISAFVKNQQTQSLHASLIVGQNTIWSQGYGARNRAENPPQVPDGDTVYRIGSATKSFTCFAVMQLRDKGYFDLDDPVTDLHPDFSINNPWQTSRPVTIRQLMGQIGGMPRYSPCNSFIAPMYSCNETTATILSRLKSEYVATPYQSMVPSYSNVAYGLLGRGMEQFAGGSSYETIVQNQIFNPLNMTRSYFDYTSAFLPNYAVGYDPYGGAQAPYVNLGWEAPTGGIYTTPNDLEKYVKALLRFDDYQATDTILDPQTLREWLEPNVPMDGNYFFGMTFPWEWIQYGNYRVATKSGGIEGWESYIAVLPELKAGFVIHQSDNSGAIDMTRDNLGEFFGFYLEPIMRALQPPPQYPANLSDYTGTYAGYYGKEYMTFNITVQTINGYPTLTGFGFLHQYWAQLVWYPQTGSEVFWLDQRNIPHPCWLDQAGIYMPVEFYRSNGVVAGFLCEGLYYGLTAMKMSGEESRWEK